jgi:GSCFA family
MDKKHPYIANPSHTFWDKAVSSSPVGQIDPAIGLASFKLGPSDAVMTMGSCFAQHVSKRLSKSGLNYLITEKNSSLNDRTSNDGFGVFTARYGNVYTILQALQLLDRCLINSTDGDIWMHKGKFVDSFRPRAVPGGFENETQLLADRSAHLKATYLGFQTAQVLVFTLGLTEGWENSSTGQIYPIAPGVSGGEFNATIHKPFNMSVSECISGLNQMVSTLRSFNPTLKIILTVSPVPLAATHTRNHVLTATFSSKAKLRVAAEEVSAAHPGVDYFPSYEIVQGLAQSGRYFQSDLREVEERAVNHVMRVFSDKYFPESTSRTQIEDQIKSLQDQKNSKVLCDEDLLLGINSNPEN